MHHAVWLYNQMLHAGIDFCMLHELHYEKLADLSGLQSFDTICFVKCQTASKIGFKALECCWLSFDTMSNGHRMFDPLQHKIMVEHDVFFSSQKISLLKRKNYTLNLVANNKKGKKPNFDKF